MSFFFSSPGFSLDQFLLCALRLKHPQLFLRHQAPTEFAPIRHIYPVPSLSAESSLRSASFFSVHPCKSQTFASFSLSYVKAPIVSALQSSAIHVVIKQPFTRFQDQASEIDVDVARR